MKISVVCPKQTNLIVPKAIRCRRLCCVAARLMVFAKCFQVGRDEMA
jgi:hypothetical protein